MSALFYLFQMNRELLRYLIKCSMQDYRVEEEAHDDQGEDCDMSDPYNENYVHSVLFI